MTSDDTQRLNGKRGGRRTQQIARHPQPQEASDTARLDYLAEITNLSVLREHGAMLSGEQARQIEKAAGALSSGYELHRRTHDTSQAFRLARR